jgi:hypothetical protein
LYKFLNFKKLTGKDFLKRITDESVAFKEVEPVMFAKYFINEQC